MMTGFERYTKKTRRAAFLEEMNQVVPWGGLCALIEPHYPKAGNGRRPKELEQMLRIHFVQQWFNLSDPTVEEALYDSAALRDFVGLDLGKDPAPDETTVCKFRHLLEEHSLGGEMLEAVNLHLEKNGIRIMRGTIVDATIIHAPSSTKNQKANPTVNRTVSHRQLNHLRTPSRTMLNQSFPNSLSSRYALTENLGRLLLGGCCVSTGVTTAAQSPLYEPTAGEQHPCEIHSPFYCVSPTTVIFVSVRNFL
jgi:hypothetical protein